MKNIFALIGLLLPAALIGQSWQWAKQIGGPGMDKAVIGHIDTQHNIYVYGIYAAPYAASNYNNCYFDNDTLYGSYDSFIAKYDATGNLIWVQNIASQNGVMGIKFTFDALNDAMYLTGSYDVFCNIDTCTLYSGYYNTGFLAKLNTNGNCLWVKNIATPSFANTYGTAITTDSVGAIYMVGYSNMLNSIDSFIVYPGSFIAKFDSYGNTLWAFTKCFYTGYQTQMGFRSVRYFNGTIYIGGNVYFKANSDSLWIDTLFINNLYGTGYGLVCCVSSSGNAIWFKADGTSHTSIDFFSMMDIDDNGNIYCAGTFSDTCLISQDTLFAIGNVNGLLTKYDSNGNLKFSKQLFSNNGISATGISVSPSGSVYLTGTLRGQATIGNFSITAFTSDDLYIAHYDSSGDCLGVDHAGTGAGYSIAADESGIYITGVFPPSPANSGSISIAGNTFSNYGWEDIIFAKHDMFTGLGGEGRLANNQLVIYANPNKGSFKLKIPDEFAHEANLSLEIFDHSGKLISQQQLKLSEEHPAMNIFGQPAGSYNVTLSNGKKVYYGRMIVE